MQATRQRFKHLHRLANFKDLALQTYADARDLGPEGSGGDLCVLRASLLTPPSLTEEPNGIDAEVPHRRLESRELQALVAATFEQGKPVGAICHGVVLAARACNAHGRSVLHGRRPTALTRQMELTAWALTVLWLGRYYRTYPITVQNEVSAAFAGRMTSSLGR